MALEVRDEMYHVQALANSRKFLVLNVFQVPLRPENLTLGYFLQDEKQVLFEGQYFCDRF